MIVCLQKFGYLVVSARPAARSLAPSLSLVVFGAPPLVKINSALSLSLSPSLPLYFSTYLPVCVSISNYKDHTHFAAIRTTYYE